jgi:hypothetical protein
MIWGRLFVVVHMQDMHRAARRDGEPQGVKESGLVAQRKVGRLQDGPKRRLLHERASPVQRLQR